MSGQTTKSFEIPKQLVWEAYRRVAANKGAAGVDGGIRRGLREGSEEQSVQDLEPDVLGIVLSAPGQVGGHTKAGWGHAHVGRADRGRQNRPNVVAMTLEARTEAIFHEDSYGYRPRRSALDAVAVCRSRCQKKNWVLDLDVEKFFDSVDHDLMVKAVAVNTDQPWVVLYVKRWLTAPLQLPDGTLQQRDRGTPQGSAVSPVLANVFLHYAFDSFMVRE